MHIGSADSIPAISGPTCFSPSSEEEIAMRFGSSRAIINVEAAARCALKGRSLSAYALAILVFTALAVPTQGQTYREESMGKFEDGQGVRSFRSRKNNVLKGSLTLAEAGDDMTTYYRAYVFPAMTRVDHRDKLASLRNELVMDLANAKNPEARAAAYDIILKAAKALAKNERYHPATRYNALLLLGQLNKSESVDNRPPVPDLSVLGTLIPPLRNDCHAMLPYGSILGVLRHAELSGHPKSASPLSPRVRRGLVKILLPIALNEQPPAGVDDQAHAWLRSRAVEAIGHLRFQSDPDVVGPLTELIVDEHADLDLRCTAAEALGRMSSVLDPNRAEEFVGRIAKLVVDCSNAEARDLYEILTGGNRGNRREGANYGPAPRRRIEGGDLPDLQNGRSRRGPLTLEDVADKRTMPIRRRHLYQLLTIQRGLAGDDREGVDGLAKLQGAEPFVRPVVRIVETMIEDLQDIDTDVQELGAKLQGSRKAIVALVPEDLDATEDATEDGTEDGGVDVQAAAAESAPPPDAEPSAEAQPPTEVPAEPAENEAAVRAGDG
jgi:hypothetical protein